MEKHPPPGDPQELKNNLPSGSGVTQPFPKLFIFPNTGKCMEPGLRVPWPTILSYRPTAAPPQRGPGLPPGFGIDGGSLPPEYGTDPRNQEYRNQTARQVKIADIFLLTYRTRHNS